jgi:exonuclease VII small subunit
MTQSDIEKLRAELEEAKLRMRDITRELDESPAAEQEDMIMAKLDEAREHVIELERALAELESA